MSQALPSLFSHQEDIARQCQTDRVCVIKREVGTGQVDAIAATLSPSETTLIVTSPSFIWTWQKTLEQWGVQDVALVGGNTQKRRSIVTTPSDVYLMSTGSYLKFHKEFSRERSVVTVLDMHLMNPANVDAGLITLFARRAQDRVIFIEP